MTPQCAASQASAAGSVGPSARMAAGTGSNCVQVERAGAAVPDPGSSLGLAAFHPFAELPRQDAAAGDRQAAGLRRLGDGADENVLLDAGEIQLPGDDAGATRRPGKMPRAVRPGR